VSAASAVSDHYATHAQLIQSDTHAPFEMLENVIDRCRFAALKSFQKNVVNRHLAHPSRWWRFHNRAAERSVRAIASKAAWVMAMRIIRLTVTFRYFVGFHSRAIRSASAI
jgi:hypothetical protein